MGAWTIASSGDEAHLEPDLCVIFADAAPKNLSIHIPTGIKAQDCTKRRAQLWHVYKLFPTVRSKINARSSSKAAGRPGKTNLSDGRLAQLAADWRLANGVFASSVLPLPRQGQGHSRAVTQTCQEIAKYSDDQLFFNTIGEVLKSHLVFRPPIDKTLDARTAANVKRKKSPTYELSKPDDVHISIRTALMEYGRELPIFQTWLEHNPAIYQKFYSADYVKWDAKGRPMQDKFYGVKKEPLNFEEAGSHAQSPVLGRPAPRTINADNTERGPSAPKSTKRRPAHAVEVYKRQKREGSVPTAVRSRRAFTQQPTPMSLIAKLPIAASGRAARNGLGKQNTPVQTEVLREGSDIDTTPSRENAVLSAFGLTRSDPITIADSVLGSEGNAVSAAETSEDRGLFVSSAQRKHTPELGSHDGVTLEDEEEQNVAGHSRLVTLMKDQHKSIIRITEMAFPDGGSWSYFNEEHDKMIVISLSKLHQ